VTVARFLADASSVIGGSAQKACGSSCGNGDLKVIFGEIADALIFVVGAVSVIMIIVAGLRYVTANGDAKATESAKNTILYAVIGIVVAVASYAIVTFVTGRIK
jgi:hypothetical protein